MTLRELYTFIEECVAQIPDIKTTIENDLLKINEMRDVKYGVFAITQNQHTSTLEYMRFSLNLFYIDRLVNSQDNEVQIQSHAIEILRQLLRKLEDTLSVSDAQYNVFSQRFQDLCAGAWAVVTISVPVSDCTDF